MTQPPAPAGRNKKLTPSPVHILAESLSIPLFIPQKANETDFLTNLQAMSPDLCVTAAYGNFLPTKFLKIPKFGTLNIHPSLLPKYRGASPVQRALENGETVIGVSVLKTVLKMDAGPILSQIKIPLEGHEKAEEVLALSFDTGIKELVRLLPSVWDNSVALTEQDESQATLASKLSVEESPINFQVLSAATVHNRCRGFSQWPGIWTPISIDKQPPQRIKIITTHVLERIENQSHETSIEDRSREMTFVKVKDTYMFRVVCGDGSVLGISELQPVSKKVQSARDFYNGLRGQKVYWDIPDITAKITEQKTDVKN